MIDIGVGVGSDKLKVLALQLMPFTCSPITYKFRFDKPTCNFILICAVGLWVLRPLTGVLYQPRVIAMMIVEKLVE
jgi:hypothetical protein